MPDGGGPLLDRSRRVTLLRFAADTGSGPMSSRLCGRIGLAAARILVADFSRRLSPGGRVGHVPPTLGLVVPRATARAAWRRFSVGLVRRPAWVDAANRACIAGPARMLATTDILWMSRDRPCGAPLVRFCSPSAFSSHAASWRLVGPMMPLTGRCRFGVRRAALLAPRVRPALPQPIRSPMRFCARRPRRDPGHACARVPVNRGRRRHESCVVSIHRRRRSATRCRSCVARPGRSAASRRRSWGSSLRSVAPAREASGALSAPS